jgi:6-phosphogluconolactonase (cycloisomerase 2 family)
MVKRAAALVLVCLSMGMWVGCGPTSSTYMYVAIPGSNEIVVYREDPNSGILTQLVGSPVTAGQAVQAIAVHPSGKFLCAANSGEGDVSIFTIAPNGGITEVTPRTVVGTAPTLLAMDSAGSYLYVGNSGSFNISVFSINATGYTPTLTEVTGSPFPIGLSPINMAVSPSGGFLYVTGAGAQSGYIEVFSLSQGILTSLPASPFTTGLSPYGLAIATSGGFLYTANNLNDSISEFTINPDGSLTQFANSPFGQPYPGPFALLIDKSSTYLYVANQASTFVTAYSIGTNGALTGLTNSPFAAGSEPSVLATDPGGKYLFVGDQKQGATTVQSFSLDPSSGNLTSVSTYTLPGPPSSMAMTP